MGVGFRGRLLVWSLLPVLAAWVAPTGVVASAAQPSQPNVVLIVVDDAPEGVMDAMPATRALIRNPGVQFANGMIPTSLCCPSRASLLTGNFAHTTGVYTNLEGSGFGGWSAFQRSEGSTLATHLQSAGYRTALVGKYINGYGESAPKSYVPPGWDAFVAMQFAGYYRYELVGTVSELHGAEPEDYSTDVLARHAIDIVESTPAEQPLFLYFAPYAPHAPFTPAPRHQGLWHPEPLPGSFNEADMSDKPTFMQDLPLVARRTQLKIQRKQHEALMSVDEAIASIFSALGPRAENTLFVFLSDNGYLLGSHRLVGKNVPYVASTEVPMLMRWDGHLPAGTVANRIMLNIDLTATIAEAAGAQWPMEGRSFFGTPRRGTVLEQTGSDTASQIESRPAYCGYRTKRYLLVEWSANKGIELYDYELDPDELQNVASSPQYRDVVSTLRSRAEASCSPVPPGFTWR